MWGLATHIIKKTTTSSPILRSAPITYAFPTSSPPFLVYHKPPHTSQPASSNLELNNKLVNLAKHGQYDEAYRLCNHLFENKINIKHHIVYEKAALAAVDLGRTNEGLEKFTLWFSLVPDRYELSPLLTSQRQYIYSDTRFSLLRCGNPRAYLKFIMVFGNIMAAKGYTTVSFLEIARIVVMFARKGLVVDYFKKLEEATAYYYWKQEPDVGGWVLTWFWEVVVKLYLERGWLRLAFGVVMEKDGKFELSAELLKELLKELEAMGDARRVSVLQAILDRSAAKEVST
jgi:tetratricopeptide (TPR) repeat protein